jgi:hypothetical protein
MTRRSLKPGHPLLVGTLFIHERPSLRARPVLGIEVHCPFCHDRRHVHGWGESDRLDAVSHRAGHCVVGSPIRDGYHIGLDPTRKVENRVTLAEFARQSADWQARSGPAVPIGTPMALGTAALSGPPAPVPPQFAATDPSSGDREIIGLLREVLATLQFGNRLVSGSGERAIEMVL